MKSFAHNILIAASIFASAAAMTACGKSGGGGAAPVVAISCIAPNSLNNFGQCVNINGLPVGNGLRHYAQARQGSLQITNSSAYREFLKNAMAVCDRYSGSNQGVYSCQDSWLNGDAIIALESGTVSGNTMNVTFQVEGSRSQAFDFFSGVETSLPYRNPLTMQTVVSAINNSQGFEARQNVNRGLFQLQVTNGKLQDNQIQFQLAWGNANSGAGQVFATGTLYRY